MPKSGGWLETVKKALGFIELALAFKFLSNADLAAHWGILKREVFITVWTIIFTGLALYILHFFAEGGKRISGVRVVTGTAVFLFVVYLFTGLTSTSHANLTLLSGFPPPMSYSTYDKENSSKIAVQPAVVNDYSKAFFIVALAKILMHQQ